MAIGRFVLVLCALLSIKATGKVLSLFPDH